MSASSTAAVRPLGAPSFIEGPALPPALSFVVAPGTAVWLPRPPLLGSSLSNSVCPGVRPEPPPPSQPVVAARAVRIDDRIIGESQVRRAFSIIACLLGRQA